MKHLFKKPEFAFSARELYKLNEQCIICGEPVQVKRLHNTCWNLDHIFPQALRKWTSCPYDLLSKQCNLVPVHIDCNYEKGCTIPTDSDIDKLHTTDGHKRRLHEYRRELFPYIIEFSNLVEEVYLRQDCKCYMCREDADLPHLIIRRLDTSKKRRSSNAVLLCRECNPKWESERSSYGS